MCWAVRAGGVEDIEIYDNIEDDLMWDEDVLSFCYGGMSRHKLIMLGVAH